MNKGTSNDIQTSMGTNSFFSSKEKKRKCETTYMKQRNNKLLCTNKQQYDFVELSRKNSLKSNEQLETLKPTAQPG